MRKTDKDMLIAYFVMGYVNLKNKQVVKGLIFLCCELCWLLFMFFIGINALAGLITLGTQTQGWVEDAARGIMVLAEGDNSMIIMIYGVAVVVVTIIFFVCWFISVKSAAKILRLKRENKHINTFAEDVKSLFNQNFHAAMMALPVLMLFIFTVLPLIYMILIAFTNFDAAHQPPGSLFDWVGFTNFSNMLFFNKRLSGTFFPVLSWTLVWAVSATSTCFLGGLLLAMLINKKGVRLKKMWRTFFVITIAVPQFISLLIMRNMFNLYGPINELLLTAGLISERIEFLTQPLSAKITIIAVNLWVGVPYTMLITSGILMNIPEDMYEAARIDGANAIKIFTKITLPHVLFVLTPYLITQFVGNINNFNVIYFLTEGNPTNSSYYYAGSTDLLVTWLYKLTMDYNDYNLASTVGILIFIIVAAFSLITYRFTASYKNEEDFA